MHRTATSFAARYATAPAIRRIGRMATLWDEQRRLAEAVRIAERWANS